MGFIVLYADRVLGICVCLFGDVCCGRLQICCIDYFRQPLEKARAYGHVDIQLV